MDNLFASCLQLFSGGIPAECALWIKLGGVLAIGGLQFTRGGKPRPKTHRRKLIKNTAAAEKLGMFLSSPSVRSTMRAILFSDILTSGEVR